MAKFINKKEQVYDLKLTSYGHYLLSIGTFKPAYYTFLDDNVIYDAEYAGRTTEGQNEIHKRIKDETQYLESLTFFRDIESGSATTEGALNYFKVDMMPTLMIADPDIFRFNSVIGDAFLDGPTQVAPAWKVATLQGNITSSTLIDADNNDRTPQINMELKYKLSTKENSFGFNPEDVRDIIDETPPFVDNYVIQFESADPLLYVEEVNTETLMENFEIEVFEVLTGSIKGSVPDTLVRKYFKKMVPQVVNGFMETSTQEIFDGELLSSSVEYYFDILTDSIVDQERACLGAEFFNKQTYYVDIDFECEDTISGVGDVYFDIYGTATEPEICQD